MKKKTQDSYGKINKQSLQNLHINHAKNEQELYGLPDICPDLYVHCVFFQ